MTRPGALPANDGLPDETELRARHALANSVFAQVDGVDLHYVDEGSGPAVFLLHGSYASLHQWDDWSTALRQDYRIVRLDWPAFGLSGPDPAGDYTCERKLALILALAERLHIKRFVVVGTSSAGVPAAALAANYPDRVSALILNKVAAGPLQHDHPLPPEVLHEIEQDALHPGRHAPSFWRAILHMHYAKPERLSQETVDRWTELNNRRFAPEVTPDPLAAEAEFARTPADLARVTCPTLLLWSDQDHEVPIEREGQMALHALGCIDKELRIVPNCGHMAPDECGLDMLRVAMPFLERVTEPA